MKNKKMILVVTLVIAILMLMVPYVKATDGDLSIIRPGENSQTPTNNDEATVPIIGGNNNTTTNVVNNQDNTSGNTLPKTGVAENTTLVVFIAICVVSAVYAFVRIRNYKNI